MFESTGDEMDYKEMCEIYQRRVVELEKKIQNMNPCDCCRFNPPSSCDGKPCTMCVAEKKVNYEED